MFNQLLKLFVWNSLTHLCLSASISTAPSTTPACFPGSSYVNDCMSYTCDENGQWQEFEFTRTDECCLKSYHPACAEWDSTPAEFIVTTESPPTTTSTPMCVSGSTKAEDCRIFFCQDGQWQGFEFTATRECCLQTFHPKCQAMGFTSTGQTTDVTSTEFIVTTESPPATTSTPLCESGSIKSEDCRMFICQDGQWLVGEFTATRECCLQTFHPRCQTMGFTSTASISTAPSTTPACFPGSSYVNDCMSYTCDENGQWQEFEFTRTDECCLKSYHPACAEWGTTPSEFIVTTESPPTTTSTPMCVSGSTKAEDCMIFYCQDGQWQGFEFTATQECCLQTFHPKCQAMGFTSTGQATDVTSTEFIVTTESPPTTTSTPLCESGSIKSEDCRIFICQDGQWLVGEFTATRECCLQTFHPRCQTMGFTSTEFIVTTESPPTTQSTHVCDSGSTKAEDCIIFFCQDGQWQGFEFTATKECCLQTFHPKCQAMGFTSTGQATGLTSTEFIATTESPPTTTSTPLCDSGLMKAEDCRIFVCQDGQWQVGEFTATKECCLQTFHPKCQVMGFTTTGQATGFTSTEFTFTTIATTTRTPTCEFGSGRVQDCTIYLCENGEWQPFEFLASEECCLKVSHPMCIELGFTGGYTGFTSPVSSSSTGSPNADCSPDYSHVQDCGIYICENGQWQLFEFFASEECCEKEYHPRCAALITTPQDDRSPKDLPLTDSDYDSSEEELDVLLIRLPLFPALPFPVAYRNGRPLNSHKEMSGGRHAEHRRK